MGYWLLKLWAEAQQPHHGPWVAPCSGTTGQAADSTSVEAPSIELTAKGRVPGPREPGKCSSQRRQKGCGLSFQGQSHLLGGPGAGSWAPGCQHQAQLSLHERSCGSEGPLQGTEVSGVCSRAAEVPVAEARRREGQSPEQIPQGNWASRVCIGRDS